MDHSSSLTSAIPRPLLRHSALCITQHEVKGRGLGIFCSSAPSSSSPTIIRAGTVLAAVDQRFVIRPPSSTSSSSSSSAATSTSSFTATNQAFRSYHKFTLAKRLALMHLANEGCIAPPSSSFNAAMNDEEQRKRQRQRQQERALVHQWYVSSQSLPVVPARNGVVLSPSAFKTQRYKQLCASWRAMAEALADDEEACASLYDDDDDDESKNSGGLGGRLQLAQWALSMVLSRNIGGALYPLIDLANHDAASGATAEVHVVSRDVLVDRLRREAANDDAGNAITLAADEQPSSPTLSTSSGTTSTRSSSVEKAARRVEAQSLWRGNENGGEDGETKKQATPTTTTTTTTYALLVAKRDLKDGDEVSLCYHEDDEDDDGTDAAASTTTVNDGDDEKASRRQQQQEQQRDHWLFTYGFVPSY